MPGRKIWLLALAFLAVLGASQLIFSAFSLSPLLVYRKDFIQEYLLPNAWHADLDPYLPVPELAARLLNVQKGTAIPHAATHPPPIVFLGLPYAVMSYQGAAIAWFITEILCLLFSALLIIRWWSVRYPAGSALLLALIVFAWSPVVDEIVVGQLNTVLLLLLTGAWMQLRAGREIAGGSLLGLALSIKMMAWPIVLFLLIRRNWKAAVAAMTIAGVANLIAAGMIGIGSVMNFYLKLAPGIAAQVRANEGNFSIWTVGWRLFEGMHCEILGSNIAPPLIASPFAARVVSVLLPVTLLLIGLWAGTRTKNFDTAFALLVGISIVLNPVVWSHYLVLLLIPIAVMIRQLREKQVSTSIRFIAFVTGAMLLIPRLELMRFVAWFSLKEELTPKGLTIYHVPFSAGLLTLVPLVAALAVMWLLWHMDRLEFREKRTLTEGSVRARTA